MSGRLQSIESDYYRPRRRARARPRNQNFIEDEYEDDDDKVRTLEPFGKFTKITLDSRSFYKPRGGAKY